MGGPEQGQADAGPPPLRAILRHPVPVLWRMARSGRGMVSEDVGRTAVMIRGVAPERFEPHVVRLAVLGPLESFHACEALRFEGCLWMPATGLSGEMKRIARRIAGGRDPTARFERGLWETGPPYRMELARHLCEHEGFLGMPLPAGALRDPVLRLDDAAAAAVREDAADRLAHDGTRILRRIPLPGVFGFGRPATAMPSSIHGVSMGMVHAGTADYVMPYGSVDGADEYVGLLRELGFATAARAEKLLLAASTTLPSLAGLERDHGDATAFVDAAAGELLDILRQRPAVPGLRDGGEALWPWAMKGSIGAILPRERPEALATIRAVAGAIAGAHALARHRNRCALLVAFADRIARPRVEPPVPEADALSLSGLAP